MSNKKSSQSIPVAVVPPRLLSVKQAAAYLSCTVWFARRLAWEKRVPFVRLGKSIQFDRSDLDKYIDAQKQLAA